MKVILLGSQKGGVGKSTLTISLAAAAAAEGARVLVCDLDNGQGSARSMWLERGVDDFVMMPADPLPEGLAAVIAEAAEEYDYMIIDSPPSVSAWLPDVIKQSDLVMVVTGDGGLDLSSSAETFAVADGLGAKLGFVLNKVDVGSKDASEALAELEAAGTVLGVVGDRKVHKRIVKTGKTAVDFNYAAPKSEIQTVWKQAKVLLK